MSEQTHPTARRSEAQEPGGAQVYYLRNQQVVVPDGCMAVGRIIGVHGLRGEVKVELHTDFPARYAPGVVLMVGATLDAMTVEQVREHKEHLLVKFAGVNDRTAAENLRNRWIFVDEADAATLDAGAYWVHDIIGLEVFTAQNEPIGRVSDVLTTGANDVYIVQPAGAFNRGREVLLPALAEVILSIDLEHRRMIVHLPAGLLDE